MPLRKVALGLDHVELRDRSQCGGDGHRGLDYRRLGFHDRGRGLERVGITSTRSQANVSASPTARSVLLHTLVRIVRFSFSRATVRRTRCSLTWRLLPPSSHKHRSQTGEQDDCSQAERSGEFHDRSRLGNASVRRPLFARRFRFPAGSPDRWRSPHPRRSMSRNRTSAGSGRHAPLRGCHSEPHEVSHQQAASTPHSAIENGASR